MHKPQIVFVHGGESFDTNKAFYAFLKTLVFDPAAPEQKKWRKWIKDETIDTHECIILQMPNPIKAEYIAWALWFDKVLPYLRDGVILVGHSLGGGFLLRYLTENKLPIPIRQVHLVAPCVDSVDCPGVGGFAIDVTVWKEFASKISEVHLWHSADDMSVPLHHSERFKNVYLQASLHLFTDRGHFIDSTFPELLAEIRRL